MAFNGALDPYKPVTDTILPAYLPKRGTAMDVPNPTQVEIKPLTQIQAAIRLRTLLGRPVTAEDRAHLSEWYPDGVMEEQLQEAADHLDGKFAEPAPRLVAVK